jgi:hypothetical protein
VGHSWGFSRLRARYYRNHGHRGWLLEGLLYDWPGNEGRIKIVAGKLHSPAKRDSLALWGRRSSVIRAEDKKLTWRDLGRVICRYGG